MVGQRSLYLAVLYVIDSAGMTGNGAGIDKRYDPLGPAWLEGLQIFSYSKRRKKMAAVSEA